jgi:enamine deaminase RidA (YjgF/YER057c/UK114 family)
VTDPAVQANEALDRLARTLAAGGMAWPEVVDGVVYVADLKTAPPIVAAMAARFGGRLPVGTVVGSGLVSPDGRVEIMLTAGK